MRRSWLLLALLAPTSLVAQTRTLLAPFVSADGSIGGSPVLVGANLSREAGLLGVRVGALVDAQSTPLASWARAERYRAVYGADVDGLLFVGRPEGESPVPYLLVGVGGRMLHGPGSTVPSATWSYGAGVRTPVAPWLSLEGEARHREPMTAGAVPAGTSAGWEFRFGLGVRVSGGARRHVAAPAPVAVAAPRAAPTAASAGAAAARRRVAASTLDLADDFVGTRYRWGGNTPDQGFDCSGFVRYVFARNGVELPRVSRDQARVGIPLPLEVAALEPGDLIAFASRGSTVDHIAIYVGEGRIIHSSASGGGVRFDDLYSQRGRWYREHMVAARRVIDGDLLLGLR